MSDDNIVLSGNHDEYIVLSGQLRELAETLMSCATTRRTARMEYEGARAAFNLAEDALHVANFDYNVALDIFTNAANKAALT